MHPNTRQPGIHERKRRCLTIDYQYRLSAAAGRPGKHTHSLGVAIKRCIASTRRQFLPHYFSSPPKWRLLLRSFVGDRAAPDFFVIGPGKSGTSDLAVSLMSHPNVLTPLVKEVDGTDPLAWRPCFPTLKAVRRARSAHGVALCPLVGPYLHSLDLAMNISRLKPDAKVVIHLRNPVDLVFSYWKWVVLHTDRRQVETSPFLATYAAYIDAALEVFPGLQAPLHSALHNGIYWYSVSQWLRYFPPGNVLVLNATEYFLSRSSYLRRIEQFVGLPPASIPQQLPVANQNPLDVPAPDRASIVKLKRFFEPYNSRLWEILGTAFPW